MNLIGVARAVVAAVTSVPGIAGVVPARSRVVATYGRREHIEGVAVRRAADALFIEVHVRARYSASLDLPGLAAEVRTAVRTAVAALLPMPVRQIDVTLADLEVDGE